MTSASPDYKELFKVGDRLIVELRSKEIFEGIYADGGKDRLVLTEVFQHNNNNKLGGFYEFYRSEIGKVHRLKAPVSKESNQAKLTSDNADLECKVIKVSEKEYFRLKDMSKNFIYIENADKRYFDAIKILSDSETIGVACLGIGQHRSRSFIQLLVLCTWKQVYIFDLHHLNNRQLYPEIKEIFESEYVCKVIHKSAGLVDVLFREYKVYMQNTFDTQIVDLMLQKTQTGISPATERNLSECLLYYLNFPSSILDPALGMSDKKWHERPLSDKTKLYASQLVTYLILLKEHFQKLLLKEVYNTIAKVQDHVYDLDDFEFLNYNKKKEVSKWVQDLLPKLKQLDIKDNLNEKM